MASGMLSKASWVVVGSHGKNPIASQLMAKLQNGGKQAVAVNPGLASGTVLGSLKEVPQSIEVVDLVINPAKGFAVVEEMIALKIPNLWIQPGASSPEILALAAKGGINVHQGCVLREATW